MKIMLVNPPRFNGIPVIREERCEITERYSVLPPYSLLQIASILRKQGHQVKLIDANGWNLTWDELAARITTAEYDVLIFRFTPTTFDWDLKLAAISKKVHKNALTAGICWTLQSLTKDVMECSPDLDVYIMHEYETVSPALVNALSNNAPLDSVDGIAFKKGNQVCINKPAKTLENWDSIPLPAYDLLHSLKRYYINTPHGSPFTIVYASKGCPFSCIFCTERNTKLKSRPAAQILSELRYLRKNFGVNTISFFDETFTVDHERVKSIANGIKEERLGITWYCNTRVNLVSKDLLKIMHDGGCRGISFGIESGNQGILDKANKGTKVYQAERAIKWAKEVGIKVYCSFIFGLPGENWHSINETIQLVRRTLPTGAQFNVAVPYPGTELYNIAVRNGWVKAGLNWRQLYQHEANMRSAELNYEDLVKARKMGYRSIYFNPVWWVQNILYTLRNVSDIQLATRYSLKVITNYVFNDMTHAH